MRSPTSPCTQYRKKVVAFQNLVVDAARQFDAEATVPLPVLRDGEEQGARETRP